MRFLSRQACRPGRLAGRLAAWLTGWPAHEKSNENLPSWLAGWRTRGWGAEGSGSGRRVGEGVGGSELGKGGELRQGEEHEGRVGVEWGWGRGTEVPKGGGEGVVVEGGR